jgi:hypothetical protein
MSKCYGCITNISPTYITILKSVVSTSKASKSLLGNRWGLFQLRSEMNWMDAYQAPTQHYSSLTIFLSNLALSFQY